MKTLLFLVVILSISSGIKAQTKTDSAAYQAERNKINAMLVVRSRKFGEYDKSVGEHTGIFGLQTRKDIRRSNDILMNIVSTDDNIFKELKILLDYRAFRQTQVQTQTVQVQESNIGYMTTINKLRDQVSILKAETLINQNQADQNRKWIIILLIVLAASILLMLTRRTIRKA